MALKKPKERRQGPKLVLLERRKGKAWMYGEIGVCAVLLLYFACRVAR